MSALGYVDLFETRREGELVMTNEPNDDVDVEGGDGGVLPLHDGVVQRPRKRGSSSQELRIRLKPNNIVSCAKKPVL